MPNKQIPRMPWFTWPSDEPQLIGSRCRACGDYFMPKVSKCRNPNCRSSDVEEHLFSRKGQLWSYTVQHYPPPFPYRAPDPFVPFGIAQVKLPEGIKINGQISSGIKLDSLKIGMDMEFVIEKLYTDAEGNDIMAWKFKPAGMTD